MNPILIRVDDFPSGMKEPCPGLEHLYRAFHSLMDAPYLLAVVPSAYAPFCGCLTELENVELAVHGYDHRPVTLTHPYDEFQEMGLEQTYTRLHRAFTLAPGSKKAYVAPFNRYTQNVLASLLMLGCQTITAGPETARDGLDYSGFTVVPSDFYGRSEEIVAQIKRRGLPDAQLCVSLHWTWELQGMIDGKGRLSELISMIQGRVKPWSEVFGWE